MKVVARHCPDLTERQAVRVLLAAVHADDDAVAALRLRPGAGGSAGVLTGVGSSVGAAAAPATKAKKGAAASSSSSSSSSASYSSSAGGEGGEGITRGALLACLCDAMLQVRTRPHARPLVPQALAHHPPRTRMQRGAAFAVLPLAEAVRALVPAPAAAVLLRAMTLFLRGLCDGHADRTDTEDADADDGDGDGPRAAAEPIVAARSDAQVRPPPRPSHPPHPSSPHPCCLCGGACACVCRQVRRAATWAEALLDAHFSAMALDAARHGPTRRALRSALEAVAAADLGSQEVSAQLRQHLKPSSIISHVFLVWLGWVLCQVEAVLGQWTHISRMADIGGTHAPPSTALYQVEQLRF